MSGPRLIIGNRTYSSWSMRGWLALQHTGTAHEIVRIPLDTPEFFRRIHDYSPSGRVPALHHEGLVIWDTLAIVEYLAERYPAARLWPAEARLRAYLRSACAEMHAGFEALRAALPFNCRASNRRVEPDAATRADIERVCAIWDGCREIAATTARDGPWLAGEFSAADCMYIPVALRFHTYGIGRDGFARRYVGHVTQCAPVREWVDAARAETEIIAGDEVGD